MKDSKLNLKGIYRKVSTTLIKLRPYGFLAFIVFVVLLYGFITLKIGNLRSAEPTDEQINSQVEAANIPYIDAGIVRQLESLEDNSVSVKALFDQARSNPFQ